VALGILVLYLTVMVAVLIHELGHYLAARLASVPVTTIQVGAPPALASFSVFGARFELGPKPSGRVKWDRPPPAGRRFIVTLAGPVANLVTAPLALALPLPAPITTAAALIFAVTGLANLMPYRSAPGRTSDGLTLLGVRARSKTERELRSLLQDPGWHSRPEAADILLRGCRADVEAALARRLYVPQHLRQAGRIRDLLWLHQLPLHLPAAPSENMVSAVHHMEWQVATVSDIPLADANLAGRRMAWVLKHITGQDRIAAQHTMAVVRLRQRQYGEVEPLCAGALAAELQASQRASVLATIAMARHAAGQSGHETVDDALSLDPDAELVAEAVNLISHGVGVRGSGRGA
jgi:hypothetical protein